MTCYSGHTKDGSPFFLCGDLGAHCAECNDVSENLCDYPVGDGRTCDRAICHQHSNEVAPNMHYCTAHFKYWLDFEKSGGVKKVLENVTPFGKWGTRK